jgi:glycosyltransferase involved in cell wall biosynthesis
LRGTAGNAASRGDDRHPRAVVLVGNPAAPYSRGLRIARALSDAGYAVEIAAVSAAGLPDDEHDGPIRIRRFAASGAYRSMAASYQDPGAVARIGGARRRPLVVRAPRAALAAARRWLFWPHTVRGWWTTLARELEPADLYHACGSLTIAPALAARARDAAAGRRSVVIYDAVDRVFAGNSVLGMPAPVRWIHRGRERRWARAADARTTVNDALARQLAEDWDTAVPLAVPNYPEPGVVGDGPPPDLVRRTLGLPATTRIVEFQGRLGPNLGLDEAAEACLLVADAALVLVGFGRWTDRSRARDADPRFAGRHFTLPAVHPDQLLGWTASADVALVPLPPVSSNQRSSTPNKFWEAIAAGTPVVVGPDLPVMNALVEELRLGVVARSLHPADLASAIRAVLDRPDETRRAERDRIRQLALDRFSWPVAAEAYRDLVRGLAIASDRLT